MHNHPLDIRKIILPTACTEGGKTFSKDGKDGKDDAQAIALSSVSLLIL